MLHDLQSALRIARRNLGVSLLAIATLAVGIGSATAVFTVVESVILRPLPFREPDRLVRIWERTPEGRRFSASEPNYLDLAAGMPSLEAAGAYSDLGGSAVLSVAGEAARVSIVRTSASLLTLIGVRPRLGRLFTEADDRPGAPDRVLLSDRLWQLHFGGDPAVVGSTIRIDERGHEIIGVLPAGFAFPHATDLWVPLRARAAADRDDKALAIVARRATNATEPQMEQELRALADRLSREHPESNGGWSFEAVRFDRWIVPVSFRDAAWVLSGAVALLLLLACANVANLLIASASTRGTEIRVRAALGATRQRLVRQLLTESALLAVLGTGAGVLVAAWILELVRALGTGHVPRVDELRMHVPVLAFASLIGMASCLAFGLAPAWHATRADLRSGLEAGIRHTVGGRRLRDALVVVEIAIALMLLVGAALLANSFIRLTRVDPGFRTADVLAAPIDLPSRYDDDRVAGFYRDLLERIRVIPGVMAAGATSTNPFRESGYANNVTPEDRAATAPASGLIQAKWRSVTPGFTETLEIPLLSGRSFDDTDITGRTRVVLVSETLARALWPGRSAVGQRILWGGLTGQPRTVIGITGDIRDVDLAQPAPPILFLPHAQVDLPSMTVLVRTTPGLLGIPEAIREVLRGLDPALPVPTIEPVAAGRCDAALRNRFELSLLSSFAGIAVLLAVTGVYGMLAFAVAERRRELAIRVALGASGQAIRGMVVRQGLLLALAGLAAGIIGAAILTRTLAGLLFDVQPTDPVTFALAATSLFAAASIACLLPARRAARLDPIAILRN